MSHFLKKKNNSRTILSNGITAASTSMTVADASKLPSTTDFVVTIWDKSLFADPSDDPNTEIVKVTNIVGNVLTITRAQESTSAVIHSGGNAVELLITAGQFQEIETDLDTHTGDTSNPHQLTHNGLDGLNIGDYQHLTQDELFLLNLSIGSILETVDVDVTSNGSTITLSVQKSGAGDLSVFFSDGFYAWDTTPADTITLTPGSDTSPQINYIYFLQSTKTLTVSTSDFPSPEHAPIATVLCQSASSLQTDGAYKVHVWTDHIALDNDNGHLAHINSWIRSKHATWLDGVMPTLNITTNVGVPDDVIFTNSAGNILQLHKHIFPACSATPDLYIVNDSVTPYNKINNLNSLLTDSNGNSLSDKRFSLVIWGVVSEDSADCKLFVNLPSGSYSSDSAVISDANRYANFNIPSGFKGTGFLISELKLRHQSSSGGTWTSIQEVDLRGFFPSIVAGGNSLSTAEFEDNAFKILDEGDNTKIVQFQASDITTGNTRIITVPDKDITIADDTDLQDHIDNTNNPHNVVASQTPIDASGETVQDFVDEVEPLLNGSIVDNLHKHFDREIIAYKDRIDTKNAVYTVKSEFIFSGTNNIPVVSNRKIEIIASVDAGNQGDVRIFDATNANIIAEKTGISALTSTIFDMGTISNLPTTQAIFEIQLKNNGTDKTMVNSILITTNE